MGVYRCVVTVGGQDTVSLEGHIELEGLPHFSEEPQDKTVAANHSFSLVCRAHGPPEPVHVIWLQDGAPLNKLDQPLALSPSTLTLSGTVSLSPSVCMFIFFSFSVWQADGMMASISCYLYISISLYHCQYSSVPVCHCVSAAVYQYITVSVHQCASISLCQYSSVPVSHWSVQQCASMSLCEWISVA
uniref:Ig-like domain-containing protein n=1 Tax=Lepisosteus oculatus TaxID=7918 RepID=W5LW85_LEPOC